jgi:hypothetical protein
MGCKESVGCRIESDWQDKIDSYAESQGMENRSDAIKELLKTGYRERQSPLLYRAKQTSKDALTYLPMVSATVVIVSQLSSALTPSAGYQIGIVLLAMAAVPLALVEAVQRGIDAVEEAEQ